MLTFIAGFIGGLWAVGSVLHFLLTIGSGGLSQPSSWLVILFWPLYYPLAWARDAWRSK